MKRILIVDDNFEFLRLLSSVLNKSFETIESGSVNDAIKLLETTGVDAICSDFNMRDGTGLELLEQLRHQGVKVPFMLMSASDDRYLVNKARNLGASFCCKTDHDLIVKIKAMV